MEKYDKEKENLYDLLDFEESFNKGNNVLDLEGLVNNISSP